MSLTWALAVRAIRGRPLRSLLNGLAVVLGIAVILGVAVTVSGLDTESRSAAQASRPRATTARSCTNRGP